jgi:hypothetical protein
MVRFQSTIMLKEAKMRSRLAIAGCIILGSFILHCGQTAMQSMNLMDGGTDRDAKAQTVPVRSGRCSAISPLHRPC